MLAVEQDVKTTACQLQRAVVVGHARDELERVVDVLHAFLLQQLWHVVDELATLNLRHGPLALDHHLGQGVDDAVHAQ